MRSWPRNLPFIDAGAGLAGGIFVLLLRDVLAGFYGFSVELLTFLGLVNLAYAPIGLVLGKLRPRPAWLLWALAIANSCWALVCTILLSRLWPEARILGLVHLGFEGIFVAGLAFLEVRYRREILAAA